MRKISLLLIAALFTHAYLQAQTNVPATTDVPATTAVPTIPSTGASAKVVYAGVGGPGLLSINYDMRFSKTNDGFGFRAGFGGWSIQKSTVVFVPLGLNYITSRNNKDYFEAGFGGTIVSNSIGDGDGPFESSFGFLSLGYRKQPAEGGYFFKASLVPVFGKGFFWPYYAGVGFGYTF